MRACRCPERRKPISGVSGRLWRVISRLCSYSAFNGYRRAPSAYSGVRCLGCGAAWRTKAKFVSKLADISLEEYKAVRKLS